MVVNGAFKLPFVSIIIPTLNAERTLDKTLKHLLEIDYPPDKMEIIMADGGSTDRTIEMIQSHQERYSVVKLVQKIDSQSPGQARNAALEVAKGEFILFTDGDCAPRADWIKEILKPFFRDERIGQVGGEIHTLRTDPDSVVESYCEQTKFQSVGDRAGMAGGGYYPQVTRDLPHEVNGEKDAPFFVTANCAVSKQAVEAIGNKFWDEITGEDVDLSLRIAQKGYRLFFQPKAIVDHMHRVTLKDLGEQWYGYGFGHPLLVKNHARKVLEIYIQYFGNIKLSFPFLTPGIIYVGDFHLMHLFAVLGTIFAFLNRTASTTALLLSVLFMIRYFGEMLNLQPRSKFLSWCQIRYWTNWKYVFGAIKGSIRFRAIVIEPSWPARGHDRRGEVKI